MKKIFTACLGTETNTFASIPTGHQLFEETCLFRKASYGKNVPMFGAPLAVWRSRAEAKGWQVVESLCAFAQPAGKTVKAIYARGLLWRPPPCRSANHFPSSSFLSLLFFFLTCIDCSIFSFCECSLLCFFVIFCC